MVSGGLHQDACEGVLFANNIVARTAMTFDPAKILESKRALRRDLAARPIEEKLALLDALRERQLAIRPAGQSAEAESAGILHEESAPYRAG
jgi:hypothetical protein